MSRFWILLELEMMVMAVTIAAVRRATLQTKRHHQQINTKLLATLDVLSVAQPTVSKGKFYRC